MGLVSLEKTKLQWKKLKAIKCIWEKLKHQKQVLVDSSLGVSRNILIGGGLYVEGETYLQHVTAPL